MTALLALAAGLALFLLVGAMLLAIVVLRGGLLDRIQDEAP